MNENREKEIKYESRYSFNPYLRVHYSARSRARFGDDFRTSAIYVQLATHALYCSSRFEQQQQQLDRETGMMSRDHERAIEDASSRADERARKEGSTERERGEGRDVCPGIHTCLHSYTASYMYVCTYIRWLREGDRRHDIDPTQYRASVFHEHTDARRPLCSTCCYIQQTRFIVRVRADVRVHRARASRVRARVCVRARTSTRARALIKRTLAVYTVYMRRRRASLY